MLGGIGLVGVGVGSGLIRAQGVVFEGLGTTGASLLGAGIGLAGAGLVAILAGAVGATPARGARKSEPRMIAGLVLTALGAGTLGAGLGLLISGNGPLQPFAAPFFAGSTLLLGPGIPLLVTGARRASAAERWAELSMDTQPYSPGMATAGKVLTGFGAAFAVGGVAVILADNHARYLTAFIGVPMASSATILLGIGIPLWALGARDVPRSMVRPALRFGPGSAELSWRF